ncbi:putative sodium-coupled neutral amino acid transporter 10 isoform X2 [Nymphalis io]|uniref:putative sodium-coupled neutral amino acid transporter 10 isoform X2 n=1 Tax=Inachis io TaxID=171585 RepID=UPI0021679D2A|nr:putative sodium-coupled neutral amino acid transporter 10 isoform X2 [Nymphalis io]
MGTTGQSITLANSIIGVGILAMPFCFQQCGVLLATLILLSMGLVSRVCCYFLLKSAIITRRRSYEFLAFHIFGPGGKMAVEMGIIGFLMGTCIAYFVVVGDLGPQIIAKMLNINQSDILRTSIMVIVSLVCVLPLGLLRNVDSLSNVSAATIAFYFCLVIKVIAEATTQLFTADWTSRIEMWKPSGVLQCVPIFSMALFCQTQLFEIFDSMPSLSLEKSCLVTKNAINICAGVYCTLGIFGYIAFGAQEISGNVLMSLSPTMASDVIKLGFVMSLAFSFPLVIFPCRASLYSFLYRRSQPAHHESMLTSAIPERAFRALTLGIVSLALLVSLVLPTVELVLGLAGATAGVLVCVVLPAAALLRATRGHSGERALAKFIVVLGLIILVLGTYANLQAAENSRDKYDERYITQERIDKIVEDFFDKMEKADGDGVMAKPRLENHPLPQDLLNSKVIKDSEVQPPNPVPPESHSNEKKPEANLDKDKLINEILQEQKDVVKELVSTHPKNVGLHLNEENLVNGKAYDGKEGTDEKSIEEKPQANQEKIAMMKQQELIETIKQHGEEQKELIKEQKEILDEILKTKKELEKNKKEVDNNEAKKIAVESIQKIADVAIKSLSGVTDKPALLEDAIQDNAIQKIAHEAVNKIAKKAEETLDAIKQIDEAKNKNDNDKPVLDEKKTLKDSNAKTNNIDKQESIKPEVQQKSNDDNQHIAPSNNNNIDMNSADKQSIINEKVIKQYNETLKEHSHLPDEPQSYKQGEDIQKDKTNVKNVQNVPLPIVLSEKGKLKDTHNKHNSAQNIGALKYKDDILSNIANGQHIIPRKKREIIDCTEKTTLKPEDREICDGVNSPNKVLESKTLKNIDVGQPALADGLPLQRIALHHMRSLKSIQDKKR